MKISYRIALPEPCVEDWNEMTPNGCGRFCAACEKTVVDFTSFSDEQFINYFQRNGLNICGRFSSHQFSLEIPWLDTERSRPTCNPLYKATKFAALSLLPLALPTLRTFGQEVVQQPASLSQSQVVTGTMLDENDQGIPGGSVNLKGTNKGTFTDVNGHFSMQLQDHLNTLIFEALGMNTTSMEIKDASQPVIVKLSHAASTLKDVQISGSSRTRIQSYMGGSMAVISASDIEKVVNTPSEQKFLKGAIATSKWESYNDPIIVLNGKLFAGNLTDIDPKKVKSIKIIKGIEAQALYGATGTNGVIIISTRRPSIWKRIAKPFKKK